MPKTALLLLRRDLGSLVPLEDAIRGARPDGGLRFAATAPEAVALVADDGIAAILVEQDLPGEGIEAGRRIAALLPAPRPPIVLVTTHGITEADRRAALAAGFVAFLPESAGPVQVEALLGLLARCGAHDPSSETVKDQRRFVAVGRLAGGIAHDFNNALTGIMGYAALAQEEVERTDQVHGMLEQIIKGADRAAGLARHLLTFARKQGHLPQVVDLNALAGDMDRMLRRVLRENVEFRLRRDPTLGECYIDPTLIEQLLVHLVVDAGDALPAGGVVTITTSAVEGPPAQVSLLVTGRTNPSDEVLPTTTPGVGLEIAREIVEICGGNLAVRTGIEGPEFEVRLPSRNPEPAAPAVIPARRFATGTETILLVDDEDMVLKMTNEVLTAAGYRVFAAPGPEAALEICARHPGKIDLVLTDVVMPIMNGPRMVRKMREVRSDLTVLYMSGFADDALVLDGGLEADAVLMEKPFSPTKLTQVIRQALTGRIG